MSDFTLTEEELSQKHKKERKELQGIRLETKLFIFITDKRDFNFYLLKLIIFYQLLIG